MGPVLQLSGCMTKQIAYIIIGLVAASQVACGHKSSTAADTSTAPVTSSSLSVYAASSIVALGATTIITVSGGSGTYVTATATLGTLVSTGATTFTYTAPSTATSSNETVTITDSNGLSGSTYLTISGATGGGGSTVGTTSCSGTYTVSVGGQAATMTLVGGTGGYVAGYLDMWNYKYALYGSCSITGTSGTITVTEPAMNSTYNGKITLSGSTISMSGTASNAGNSGSPANWTATATTAAVTAAAPTSNSCQGTYNATIGPNSGQILLVQDGNNKIAGLMTIQGYYYSLSGTCSGTTVNFTNVTTGSTYTGTATFTATGATLSGTYNVSGTSYNWSATR
jgi:hypothetical protein